MKLMFLYSPDVNAGDDFAPGDLGIDDGLAAASSIIDHDNEILHQAPAVTGKRYASQYS